MPPVTNPDGDDRCRSTERVAELAERYRPLAVAILQEAIRIPADEVDRPIDDGGDPSRRALEPRRGAPAVPARHDHRRRRRRQRRRRVVRRLRQPRVDGARPFDGVAPEHKKVIYFDGHTDTVQALRGQWHDKLGGAIDPYSGLVDAAHARPRCPAGRARLRAAGRRVGAPRVRSRLRRPAGRRRGPDHRHQDPAGAGSGRGRSAGAIVRAYATAAEEDNDGGGPRYVVADVLPGAGADLIPDVVVLTEGTGDAIKGALGIYRGQRGRMQIEVDGRRAFVPRLDAVRGTQPARARRCDPRRGRRRHCHRRGLRRPSVPRSRHAHRLVVGARHAERLCGARPVHVPLRPAPHRRARRPSRRSPTSRASTAVGRGPRRRSDRRRSRVPRYTQPTWRGYRSTTRRSTRAGSRPTTTRRSGRPSTPTAVWSRRTSPNQPVAQRRAHGAASPGSTSGSSRPTASGFPMPGRRRHDRRAAGQAVGVVRPGEAPGDVRHRRRHRAEHAPHRRVRRRARAAARHRVLARFPSVFAAT